MQKVWLWTAKSGYKRTFKAASLNKNLKDIKDEDKRISRTVFKLSGKKTLESTSPKLTLKAR
jgi:hypothetical protein